MEIKITLFTTLLLYAVVISQSFFYILAMTNVTRSLKVSAYIEARQLIDKNIRKTMPGVYYSTLISSIALTAFSVTNPSGLVFISSVIALIALMADMIVTIKGNIPLNKKINSWTSSSYPDNWNQYRSRWLAVYNIRQVINLTGFIVLLAGMVFGL